MIVILHLVDVLEFARMVFINPLPEAGYSSTIQTSRSNNLYYVE